MARSKTCLGHVKGINHRELASSISENVRRFTRLKCEMLSRRLLLTLVSNLASKCSLMVNDATLYTIFYDFRVIIYYLL